MSYVFPSNPNCPNTVITPIVQIQNITINSAVSDNGDDNYYIDTTLSVMGKILTFSNMNFIPKTIKLIFLFIDDIWYYKFHRTEYP
jgi:hypothetical protein